MAFSFFLGIDIGTSGTKALLLRSDGAVAAAAEAPHTLHSPRPGWSEQDPQEWWRAAINATRKVMKKTKAKAGDVRAVGLSGQMHGSVFLGAGRKPLRPALLWNDQRTAKQCAEIESVAGGREALVEMVGNPALTGFTAPKILWLRENEPRRYEKCQHILLPKDYIRYCLTGDYLSDVSDASGTLLLDVRKRAWCDALINLMGIDRALLPHLIESPEVGGHIGAAAAEEIGLSAGTPVVGGGGDQAAGAVGAGVVAPGLLSATIGTSGVIFAASDAPRTDPSGRVHTMCHAVPDTWCNFGCMLSAGGSLQWLRNTLFPEEVRKAIKARRDPGALYARMLDEAARAPAGSDDLFFLPYLTGERCPHADANARGAYIGLSPRHGRAEIIRATIEGITFGMREQISIFRSMGIAVTQVRAGGGGARSDFWRQMQADMYDAPVATINVSEGAALGAAILAAVGAGAYASVPQATGAVIKIADISRPNKTLAAIYAERYEKYALLYPALKGTFARLAQ